MRKLTCGLFLLGALMLCPVPSQAANVLINGDLDNPGAHEVDTTVAWTLDEYKQSGPSDTATFASFANHTPNPNAPGPDPDTTRTGVWFKNFSGTPSNLANADLYQDVPGTPGMKYILTAWARFESFYAGGLTQAPSIDPVTGEFILSPSPTDTFLAIDFLGAGDSILSTAQVELKANGQINNNQWKQHMVMDIAPAGTLEVRARGSAVNMLGTFGSQSAFMDDFVLECIPEPASAALGLIALLGLVGFARRR